MPRLNECRPEEKKTRRRVERDAPASRGVGVYVENGRSAQHELGRWNND
jgi:hypothetical protein